MSVLVLAPARGWFYNAFVSLTSTEGKPESTSMSSGGQNQTRLFFPGAEMGIPNDWGSIAWECCRSCIVPRLVSLAPAPPPYRPPSLAEQAHKNP